MKLTKTELREQQVRLAQLEKYVPTLQLKKAMLQQEVLEAITELQKALAESLEIERLFVESALLLSDDRASVLKTLYVKELKTHIENIAGVEVPVFESITFSSLHYALTDTPVWFDLIIEKLKSKGRIDAQMGILRTRKDLLEKECREVSIRLNLFEKVLIPSAKENIKKIRIYLGDQQLAAVCQSKIAKKKILDKSAVIG